MNIIKLIIATLIAFTALAQNPGQLCWYPSKTDETKRVCRDVSAALKGALADYIAAPEQQIVVEVKATPVTMPRYKGIAHLLFLKLDDGIFTEVIEKHPSPAIKADEDAARKNRDAAALKKETVIGKTAPEDP